MGENFVMEWNVFTFLPLSRTLNFNLGLHRQQVEFNFQHGFFLIVAVLNLSKYVLEEYIKTSKL